MKDPAVLFYTQDFITGTLLMTDEQRGKYILLLCLQHQNGKLTERDMLKICGKKDEDIWCKFFQKNGYFYNKRMLLESEKRNKYSESRRKNRMNICNTYDKHMENENINENIDKDKKEELLNKREEKFKKEVYEFKEKYPELMLNKFIDYWTEKNKSKTKMHFELEKTFEISKRLATWASRDKEYNKINTDTHKTHKEMLELANKTPDIWTEYNMIKENGKAIYIHK